MTSASISRLVLCCGWLSTVATAARADVDYLRDVKPLLARHCQMCHGAVRREGGLRIETAEFLRHGGDSGPAIKPGNSAASLLIEAVTRTENRMPAEGEPLSAEEIARLKQWIDEGAIAPEEAQPADAKDHWAFRAIARPSIPASGEAAGMTNPIDAFLADDRAARGLSASPLADKATLLRRVTFDLVGLPPTRDELHRFLADQSPDAYDRVVDELLTRPQHGERWARHWMDVWRYSDWAGYGNEVRDSQRHMWRWRDWIVESLNADRGYDRMVVDMLAGDELAPDDPATLRATGYLARNWYRFNRNVWLDNTVEHAGKAFLGLTLNCARCHDHMYDPISQQDYYRFRAIFEPYDVRVDRQPGQPNVDEDGVARVFDSFHDRPTYLFVRGQDSQPKEDEPLAAAVPGALGAGGLKIEPIRLPAAAFNPGLKRFVRDELLTRLRASVDQATAVHAEAQAKLTQARAVCEQLAQTAGATPAAATGDGGAAAPNIAVNSAAQEANTALAKAERKAGLAAKALEAANCELAGCEARIAADNARYAQPPAAEAAALKQAAIEASNRSSIAAAEQALLQAEDQVAALPAGEGADDKARQERKKAEEAVATARQKLDEARTAALKCEDYPPVDRVFPPTSTGRRLALARWIATRDNPLTARVAVNHIWLRHFGEPLVATVFNFGTSGTAPTHPALLDWLASEFIDRGWSMKQLHRLIVTSQAYRMRSFANEDDPRRGIDPENRYLWRANPRRMEAEVIRDSFLAVGGQLDLARGGPDLDHAQGLTTPRRSLYFRHASEKQMTFLKVFDAASVTECYRRSDSVVPQQALALANSPLALEQSRRLAARLWQEAAAQSQPHEAWFISAAFEEILSRPATSAEQQLSAEFLTVQATRLADKEHLTPFGAGAAATVPGAADAAMRAREDLVHVLLNHNDFITIR